MIYQCLTPQKSKPLVLASHTARLTVGQYQGKSFHCGCSLGKVRGFHDCSLPFPMTQNAV
ncbi:hypothetical protein NM2004085_2116 [Neisseria meningitidis 2004085]|nr:hypothetical protein NM2004085_2116 [Neisseria meningitidis 2004085]